MFLAVSLSSGLLQMHSQALITDPTTQALSVPFPHLKMWAVGMQWGCGCFSEHYSVWHPYQQIVTVKDLPLGGAAVIHDFKSSPFALKKANLTILSPAHLVSSLQLPSCLLPSTTSQNGAIRLGRKILFSKDRGSGCSPTSRS